MKAVVYDAGALIAAERNDRRTWAEHRVRLEMGILPLVPATVLAQVSRSRSQAQLHRFLRGCDLVAFDAKRAHASGALLAKSKTSDVIDASVVELAASRGADVVTTDVEDIGRLVASSRHRIRVVAT